MFTSQKIWCGVLLLGALLVLVPGYVPVQADGTGKPLARGDDSRRFVEELRSNGAFKFYEDTEDILRTGRFEHAFGRYVFLNAHIRGRALDAGLAAMVKQRLQFLRAQLHLGEGAYHYVPEEKPKKRKRRVQPTCPPPEKEAKAKEPVSEEKPPEIIIPPAPMEEKEATPPKEEQKPPGEEAQEPAPPPSLWDKLKGKLKFW